MIRWIIGGCVVAFIVALAITAKVQQVRKDRQRRAEWEEAQRRAAAKRAADEHGHGALMNEANPRCDRQRLSNFC